MICWFLLDDWTFAIIARVMLCALVLAPMAACPVRSDQILQA